MGLDRIRKIARGRRISDARLVARRLLSAELEKVYLDPALVQEERDSLTEPEPWSGAPLEVLARAAARAKRPPGYPDEYDLLQTAFDHAHYFCQRPDVARARLDPVAHYIRAGAVEGVDPTPWFSGERWAASGQIDLGGMTAFGHWLTHGGGDRLCVAPNPAAGDLAAAKGVEAADYISRLTEAQADVRERLRSGTLGEMVSRASRFEPLIAQTWTEATAPKVQPAHDTRASPRLTAFAKVHRSAQGERADAVVLVGDPRWGAARRMEGHLAHGLAALPGIDKIAVITTDRAGPMPESKIPKGGTHIDLAAAVAGLPNPDKQRILAETLRALRPKIGFAVNSRLTWEALGDYGPAITASVPLYGCMFCNDRDVFGRWGGYPATRFYRHFSQLAGICTDSHALKADLAAQFLVPETEVQRITVLSAPVDPGIPARNEAPAREEDQRPQVFWAGRLDPQKRLDVAYAVARALPQVDFRFWGKPVAGGIDPEAHKPENVHLMGSYAEFGELPIETADAWLYTSEWDGVPSILLEVAMTGVPIIGAVVGGTGEILRDEMAWPVKHHEDVDGFVAGLQAVLSDPSAACDRALRLREVLVSERTETAYRSVLSRLLEGARNG